MKNINWLTLKNLIMLSIPTILEEVLNTLLQYVDTAMVGHLGAEATAAVSTTTTINWLIGGFLHSIGIALLAMMSRAVGEKNHKRLQELAKYAVVLSVLFGAVLGVIALLLSSYIPVWMGAEQTVQEPAATYFFIVSLPMVFRATALIMGSGIRATLDTKTPMIINIIANVINAALDVILIYGCSLGVTGAAYATAISHTFAGVLMLILFLHKKEFRWDGRLSDIDTGLLSELSSIALPAIGTQMTSSLGYVVFAGLVSSMGTTIFSAHSIAVNAETIVYIPGYGLSSATAAMIGVALGERDYAKLKSVIRLSTGITIGIMLINGLLLYILSDPFMRLFTNDLGVAELGADMLRIVAFTEPFFGLMIAMQGIFYGMGRTKNVFFVEAGSMWGIRILLTFLCVKVWHTDLAHVWYCMITDNICKAVLLAISMLLILPGMIKNIQEKCTR